MVFIQMIGEVVDRMKFKVSSNANDAPPCVGSILCGLIINASYRGASYRGEGGSVGK